MLLDAFSEEGGSVGALRLEGRLEGVDGGEDHAEAGGTFERSPMLGGYENLIMS